MQKKCFKLFESTIKSNLQLSRYVGIAEQDSTGIVGTALEFS